jgi:hypothetical protein
VKRDLDPPFTTLSGKETGNSWIYIWVFEDLPYRHFTFVSHFTRRISIIARIPKDRSFWGRE